MLAGCNRPVMWLRDTVLRQRVQGEGAQSQAHGEFSSLEKGREGTQGRGIARVIAYRACGQEGLN